LTQEHTIEQFANFYCEEEWNTYQTADTPNNLQVTQMRDVGQQHSSTLILTDTVVGCGLVSVDEYFQSNATQLAVDEYSQSNATQLAVDEYSQSNATQLALVPVEKSLPPLGNSFPILPDTAVDVQTRAQGLVTTTPISVSHGPLPHQLDTDGIDVPVFVLTPPASEGSCILPFASYLNNKTTLAVPITLCTVFEIAASQIKAHADTDDDGVNPLESTIIKPRKLRLCFCQ
jgi:hypothetical protein